jgi:hypothetical protein
MNTDTTKTNKIDEPIGHIFGSTQVEMSSTTDFDLKSLFEKMNNSYDILMEKYLKALDKINRLHDQDIERLKRENEREDLILQAIEKAKTKKDFMKILTM